jgi:hypothetical protein
MSPGFAGRVEKVNRSFLASGIPSRYSSHEHRIPGIAIYGLVSNRSVTDLLKGAKFFLG